MTEIDKAKIADFLGAKPIALSELTKEESRQYEPLGSPVITGDVDTISLCYFGSKMLAQYGKSLDDVYWAYNISLIISTLRIYERTNNYYDYFVLSV